jgi:chorismate synthase
MTGCHVGKLFQVTVSGGSYQDGLTAIVQGVPPGMYITEQEIYGDLLLRKPGADENCQALAKSQICQLYIRV